MTAIKMIGTAWEPETRLISTQISGDVDRADIVEWEHSLHQALGQVEDGGTFKILVNLHGFTALNLDAHKQFRNIIPLTLANYGWKVGYVNMFPEEAAKVVLLNLRGIQCTAAAHCHQDESKIEKYETLFSSASERFFTDPGKAEAWIRGI